MEQGRVHIPNQAETVTVNTDHAIEAVRKILRKELAELCGNSDAPIPLDDSVSTKSAGGILSKLKDGKRRRLGEFYTI